MKLQTPNTEDGSKLEALKLHPLWREMTDKQALFLETYLTTGNKVESIKAAYNVSSYSGAASMASRLLKTYVFRTLMSAYYGYEIKPSHVTRSELLTLVSARLRDASIGLPEFRNLSAIYSELRGWRDTLRPRGTRFLKDPKDGGQAVKTTSDELMKLIQQFEQDQKEQA